MRKGLRQQFALSEKARRLQNLRTSTPKSTPISLLSPPRATLSVSQLFKYCLCTVRVVRIRSPGAYFRLRRFWMTASPNQRVLVAAAAQQQSQQSQQQVQQAYEEPPPQQYLGTGTAAGMAFQASAIFNARRKLGGGKAETMKNSCCSR